MVSCRKIIHLAILIALLISTGLYTVSEPSPRASAQEIVPRFEPSECLFTLPQGQVDGETVQCGFLSVPESRADPNSPTIKLAVAIFKSTSPAPQEPVIRLDGGPGGHSLQSAGEYLFFLQSSQSLIERGDLILLDQRGVGLSQPSLACTELTEAQLTLMNENLPLEDEQRQYEIATQACRERLAGQGINLNAYTSAENAADIHDLWTALGYEQVNLYGVSYGTRLALTIMRDYPEGIRSVILDSAFPPQVNLYVDVDRHAQRAIDLIFEECARHTDCAAAFPNLEKDFFATVERFNATPEPMTLISLEDGQEYGWLVTGNDYLDIIFSTLYVTQLVGLLPTIINSTYAGDYQWLQLIASALLLDFSVDYGMYYSVQCAEEVPFQTPDEVDAAASQLDLRYRRYAEESGIDIFATCAIWNVTPSDEIEAAPVQSDIPTLVVAGQFDPITPPDYGRATAASLSHSYFFEYPGGGHGVFDEGQCPLSITMAFLDDPLTEPDSACIASMEVSYDIR